MSERHHSEPGGTTSQNRFEPHERDDSAAHLDEQAKMAAVAKRRAVRLVDTLREITTCLDDAEQIVALGQVAFDSDMLAQRAAKNLVAELSETITRLPDGYTDAHPGVAWHQITGMRNRVVHAYQETDFELLWAALVRDFPAVRTALKL